MFKTCVCLLGLSLPCNAEAPKAEEKPTVGYPKHINKYVNDFVKTIDAADAERIKNQLSSLEEQTGIEISVVTINSIQDYPETETNFEKFATGLFNTWGIGKKDTNNGVLFLAASKRKSTPTGGGFDLPPEGV